MSSSYSDSWPSQEGEEQHQSPSCYYQTQGLARSRGQVCLGRAKASKKGEASRCPAGLLLAMPGPLTSKGVESQDRHEHWNALGAQTSPFSVPRPHVATSMLRLPQLSREDWSVFTLYLGNPGKPHHLHILTLITFAQTWPSR